MAKYTAKHKGRTTVDHYEVKKKESPWPAIFIIGFIILMIIGANSDDKKNETPTSSGYSSEN